MNNELSLPTARRDLGDGLIQRWSTAADTEKIGELMAKVYRDSEDEAFSPRARDRARQLMRDTHPFMTPNDYALIEDTSKPGSPAVAALCVWSHQWSYAGIPFGVGRPEFVLTDADYRNRGLVRKLFEQFHARSAAEGHLLQAITGISYFYRQFGYEYVLDLGGGRTAYHSLFPEKQGDDPEPYRLRPACLDDIPMIKALYDQGRTQSLIWHEAPEAYWPYYIAQWADPNFVYDVENSAVTMRYFMIVDQQGETCGQITTATKRWGKALSVYEVSMMPHINLQQATPVLLRLLRDLCTEIPAASPTTPPCSAIQFNLGRSHPFYTTMGEAIAPTSEPPYAWYVRIPDIPAFIRLIAPVLEERLAHSSLVRHNGELKLDLYRGGLLLEFKDGKLNNVAPWRHPPYGEHADAGCPPLVFLQLLLSYRSLDELKAIFPDVWAKDGAALLLNTLFPKLVSKVDPL